ncbi:iron-containing alcohol dehydrogenase [Fervidicoccus fontis]|uniref:Alcohol dehydrogenase, iron-containing n=2 Tax=Fervidicoccus fontis TaxID=683846 RepID=H9ZZR1_FERFK|nr:iron-containing alcohol dehydrogenase [Fervidicoccus fontis]AFH42218.1 alcohol dehydrogenase, iron-containing [Fervidicoccus fontis Kam940]MBE9390970.1 iron-containing alcohol dehydrogenase [Fervidicoccus fontis]PMB75379.1 MAG: bifunctional acetaldehyde-CoA/alcohol dehydrogenase [Fervidicoccus fontis]PMB76271.1 MAG: bifunctional acetaldehyde-CoA/alcohol dehydrogenase [Fervidicoccus fontis]HEW64244.1 iron-containing alcohol dehydrogenase [Fervidicoccus fontis]
MSNWYLYKPVVRQYLQFAYSPEGRTLITTFISPRIFMGLAATPMFASSVSSALKKKRAFIVTDPYIKPMAFGVGRVLQSFGFNTTVWDKVVPEPPISTLKPCAQAMEQFDADLIVAVGGGSAIDTSKVAWALYERPDIDFKLINPMAPLGLRNKALFAAIPTTSGTGSEATSAAVITDESYSPPRKFSVVHPELVPDFAVLDPSFVVGLPPKLTLGTALDAFAHAVDSYLTHSSFEMTDFLAIGAIKLIMRWLPRVLSHSDDIEARLKIHEAATMAGLAFSNGGIALTHSLGHSLGKVFSIHHGFAVGVFIPYVIGFYAEVSDKYTELAKELGVNEEPLQKALVLKFLDFFKQVKAPLTLKDLGVDEAKLREKLDVLAEYAYEDICTPMSPRPISIEEVKELFLNALKGEYGW